jgi:hypothetical protein
MKFKMPKFPKISLEEIFGLEKIKTEFELRKIKEIEVLWISRDNNFVHYTKGEIIHGFIVPLLKIQKPEKALYILKRLMVNRDSGRYFTIVREYNPFSMVFDLRKLKKEDAKKLNETIETKDIKDEPLIFDGKEITPKLLSQIGDVKLFESFERSDNTLLWGIILGILITFPIALIIGIKLVG